MHKEIQNELEDYLSGSASRGFHAHLESCGECLREVRQMQEVSGLFAVLQSPETPEPAPGFYYRVSQRMANERQASFWNVFSFDPGFARRLVFSSLMTLAVLGTFLVSRETAYPPSNEGPAAIMARHDGSIPHDDGNDRGRMLVTLASYER